MPSTRTGMPSDFTLCQAESEIEACGAWHDPAVAPAELPPGLYDELITVALGRLVDGLGESSRAQRLELGSDAAPRRLADHVGHVVSMVLASLDDEGRVETGVALVQDLLAVLAHHIPETLDELQIARPPAILTAVEPRQPDGSYREIERPLTSLHDTTLLVNAPGEPTILHELIGEIPSSQRIDVLMAFVRLSGIRPMLPKLRRHIESRRPGPPAHHHVHEQHPVGSARRTGGEWRTRPCLVRQHDDPAAREVVALPSGPRQLDCVRGFVEPDAQRDGAGPGVERSAVGCSQPRRGRSHGGGVRDVLGRR